MVRRSRSLSRAIMASALRGSSYTADEIEFSALNRKWGCKLQAEVFETRLREFGFQLGGAHVAVEEIDKADHDGIRDAVVEEFHGKANRS